MSQHRALNEETFENEIRKDPLPLLVDFWAPWCGPCRVIEPVIDQLASEYHGRARVAKVNVDENPGLAARYSVHSIPTILFFRNGDVVDRVVGAVPKTKLQEKLEAASRAA